MRRAATGTRGLARAAASALGVNEDLPELPAAASFTGGRVCRIAITQKGSVVKLSILACAPGAVRAALTATSLDLRETDDVHVAVADICSEIGAAWGRLTRAGGGRGRSRRCARRCGEVNAGDDKAGSRPRSRRPRRSRRPIWPSSTRASRRAWTASCARRTSDPLPVFETKTQVFCSEARARYRGGRGLPARLRGRGGAPRVSDSTSMDTAWATSPRVGARGLAARGTARPMAAQSSTTRCGASASSAARRRFDGGASSSSSSPSSVSSPRGGCTRWRRVGRCSGSGASAGGDWPCSSGARAGRRGGPPRAAARAAACRPTPRRRGRTRPKDRDASASERRVSSLDSGGESSCESSRVKSRELPTHPPLRLTSPVGPASSSSRRGEEAGVLGASGEDRSGTGERDSRGASRA